MTQIVDMAGLRFGRLAVISRAGRAKRGVATWNCRCDCGVLTVVIGADMRNGHTQSCGCLQDEKRRSSETKRTTHGRTNDDIYSVWRNMLSRCENENHKSYHRYGGRGIQVCRAWHSFDVFYRDFGASRPSPKHTIDRKNNDGNYEPENCQWATQREQQNNRSTNVRLSHDGETLTVTQWARKTGLSQQCISSRLKAGWSAFEALTTPVTRRTSR